MLSNALYFPYFIPRSDDWLISSLLWWEKIYLIWPEGITTNNEIINYLKTEHYQIIETVDPLGDFEYYIHEFVETQIDANISLITSKPQFDESIYLHSDKVIPLIHYLQKRELVIGKRYIVEGNRFKIDKAIEIPYMCFLADKLSNRIQRHHFGESDIVTDDPQYLSYMEGYSFKPRNRPFSTSKIIDQAYLVTFRKLGIGVQGFSKNQLTGYLKFREKYFEERFNLKRAMFSLVESIKENSQLSENDYSDCINHASESLIKETKNIEKILNSINMKTYRNDFGALISGLLALPGGWEAALGVTASGILVNEINKINDRKNFINQSPYAYVYRINNHKRSPISRLLFNI